MTYDGVLSTSIGHLGLLLKENQLVGIHFLPTDFSISESQNPIVTKIITQLQSYFKNANHSFDLPLQLEGTPFQQKVWKKLTEIPMSETRTYGELAKALNTAPRAIGQACRTNPIPIIIPCHRVVANTSLGGYSGQTQGELLQRKKWLLQHENAQC